MNEMFESVFYYIVDRIYDLVITEKERKKQKP